MAALNNFRIVDITRAMAGPYCAMMLGDFGADVIKVERPGSGDESRGWGPPFVGEAEGPYPGQSAYYLSANRNKRSLTVNLKSPQGQQIIRDLVQLSDVLIENFRTGVLDKMGLGYPELSELNPRLVYCSVSGYGRTGPYRERPGYDAIIQAEGGLMAITGPKEGPPSRVGIPIIDITSGMFAASAILAALLEREGSGQGQHVDVSLLDTQSALLANVASNYLVSGEEPVRQGNAHPNIAPYEPVQARDKGFLLGAANQRQWERLCDAIGKPEFKEDPRFLKNGDRVKNREELIASLNEVFQEKDAADWLEIIGKGGLPCGPINTVPDVFQHPQAEARGLVQEVDHPSAGPIKLTGFPYKFSRTPAQTRLVPPRLGEHNQEILGDLLGYDAEKIDSLREQGVI